MKQIKIIAILGLVLGIGSAAQAEAFTYNNQLIRYGSRGAQVIEVQECMNRLGYNVGVADGIYGPKTYLGIIRFQSTIPALIRDGVIGPNTAPYFEQACLETTLENNEANVDKSDTSVTITVEVKDDDKEKDTIPEQTTINVETMAERVSVDGSSNDYINYEITFGLGAFGDEFYIDEDALASLVYRIDDISDGSTVYDSDGAKQGNVFISLSSDADMQDGAYRIHEDDYETFMVTATYVPYAGVPAGSGSYRMVLEQVYYSDTPLGSVSTYYTRPESKFRTRGITILDD